MISKFKTIFVILIWFSVSSCQNGGSKIETDNNVVNTSSAVLYDGPAIRFDTLDCDFGRVYDEEIVGWYFKYVNVGSKNLLLLNVTASCGCTVPSYSKEPIPPGESGEIKVVFDARGRQGYQNKSVTVETNGNPPTTVLNIKAEVIKK